MPDYRVTWEFSESNGAGFSEVWYYFGGTIQSALATDPNLITARLGLLHPLNTLRRIRASDTSTQRNTGVVQYNLAGLAGTLAGPPLPPGAAAVIQFNGLTSGSKKCWLRGLPDDWYLRDKTSGQDAPPPAFNTALTAWINALFTYNYAIRRIQPYDPKNFPKFQILQVDGSRGDGTSDLSLPTVPLWTLPFRVIIGGCNKKNLPALNGHFTATNILNKIVTVPYRTPNNTIVVGAGGYVRLEVYQTSSIVSRTSKFAYYSTRTTRSPLPHSRGAKRAARIRLLA
jgi:hypothetical protein